MKLFALARSPLGTIVLVSLFLACLSQSLVHTQNRHTLINPSSLQEQRLSLHQPDIAVTFDRFLVVTSPLQVHRRQDGMLWMVTPSGLYRYDGYELRYFHEPWEKPESRMAMYLSCGVEDESGNLWLGAQYGLQRFDDRTGGFERFTTVPDQQETISNNIILSVCPDGGGSLWVGTLHGLNRFDWKGRTFQRFFHVEGDSNSLLCDTVQHLKVGRDGKIWTGSQRGLSAFDPATNRFSNYSTTTPSPFRLPLNEIRSLYSGKDGLLWFATARGIGVFDFAQSRSRLYPYRPDDPSGLRDTLITCMNEDDLGNLWIGTGSHGLVRLDRAKGLFAYYLQEEAASSLSPQGSRWSIPVTQLRSVRYFTPDPSVGRGQSRDRNVFWVTGDGAVWRVVVARQHFATVVPPPTETIKWRPLRPISPLGNRFFWTSVPDGDVVRIDMQTLRLNTYPVADRTEKDLLLTGAAVTLDGTSWLLLSNILHRFNPKKSLVEPIPGVGRVTSLCAGKDGCLWLSTHIPDNARPQVMRFDPATRLTTRYDRDTLPGEGTYGGPVISMLEDRKGEIWFGTFGRGLFRFDPGSKTYRSYSSAPGIPGALRMNVIRALLMDSTGTIWIGTDSGLHRYLRETDTFERFAATGQESNDQGHFIRSLALDQKGDIWLAHASGISKFDPRRLRFREFTEVDGLRRVQYTRVLFEPVNRMMYVRDMNNSIVAFSPEDLSVEAPSANVVITDFRVFENSISLPEPIHRMREVRLAYNQNFFSFRFSALELLRIDKINYAYKMEGFDRDWVQAGTRAYAGYTNLDHGSYLFKVKATNADGVWSDSVTTIAVIVQPPWWKTFWAYVLFTLLAISILYGTWQYDRRRIQMRHQLEMKSFEARKLLEVDRLKTQFFANISHECRTPLTLILGPAEKLSSRTTDPDDRRDLQTIERNAHSLLNLINQLLDLSKLDAGRMVLQVRPLDLVQLLQRIVASFSSLADRKKIILVFDPREQELIIYVDQEKLEKILANLLSNAFKFTGPGGEIAVTLSRREQSAGAPAAPEGDQRGPGWAEISVSDSGIGIPEDKLRRIFDRFYQVDNSSTRAQSGTGIGLSVTKELVELHRGYIRVTSNEGEGSTFLVGLPLGKDKYTSDEIVESATAFDEAVDNGPQDTVGEEAAETVEGAGVTGRPSSAPMVLIVEDNADLRRYIRGALEDSYRVAEAGDGMQGMEKAFSSIPDLVITDIMMPRMDGVELCRRLKNDERTSHIPVILLTARASEENKVEGYETGADDYIIKPFDTQELLVRVRNLIEIRRALRKKFRENSMLEPADIPLSSADAQFLKRLTALIEQHMSDPECGTEILAKGMCMSRMQLNRKLQALNGQSTHEFLRTQRLKRAEQLLRHRCGNISEIGYEVGFANPSHFGHAFKEQYGMTPSEYLEKQGPVSGK